MPELRARIARLTLLYFPPLYVSITFAAYFAGPWGLSATSTDFNLYLLLLLCCLVIGSAVGHIAHIRPAPPPQTFPSGLRIFKLGLFLGIALAIPTTYARTGELIPNVLHGLTNPAEAYQRSLVATPAIEYLRIVLAPLLFIIVPFGIHYWHQLNTRIKVIFAIYTLHIVALFISMGVNRGIFELLLGASFAYFLVRLPSKDFLRRGTLRLFSAGLFLFSLALLFFTHGQIHREGSGALSGYFFAAGTYSSLDPSSAENLPLQYFYVLFNQLTIYISQGYYGASLIYENGIETLTYGLGHSDFLLRNAAKVFGEDILSYSPIYAMEYEKNWQHGNFWFSIIPWIASDMGFLGTPIFIALLAFSYTYAARSYLVLRDPLALAVSYLLFFLFIFFPANNYIVQSGDGLIATYALLGAWLTRVTLRAVPRNRLAVRSAQKASI